MVSQLGFEIGVAPPSVYPSGIIGARKAVNTNFPAMSSWPSCIWDALMGDAR